MAADFAAGIVVEIITPFAEEELQPNKEAERRLKTAVEQSAKIFTPDCGLQRRA
jgi:hypothetical protein